MEGFNCTEVEKRILQDAPYLSNLRKEVNGEYGRKVMAYAFYNNTGTPDPAFELVFDRIKRPVRTTLDSSLCEIYSVFGKKQEEFLEKLQKKYKEKGTPHQGPHVGGHDGLSNPSKEVRSGLEEIEFFRSADRFASHFNEVCKDLMYVPRFVDLNTEISKSFDSGYYGVLISQKAIAKSRIKAVKGFNDIIVPIEFDFNKQDPTLTQALNLVEKAYKKGLKLESKYTVLL